MSFNSNNKARYKNLLINIINALCDYKVQIISS